MSNTRFIEVNSTYRDRNLWPLPAEFEIPISQNGIKSFGTAIDPVSLSAPIFAWTGNNLNITGYPATSSTISGRIANPSNPSISDTIGYSSDYFTFIIIINAGQSAQQLRNYYSSLVINVTSGTNTFTRRIISSYYLGVNSNSQDRVQITAFNNFPDAINYNDPISITDPSDFSDTTNPLIFVPVGAPQENAYNKYVLYNETINEYRPIIRYDNITSIIQLDTTGSTTSTYSSGPISASWQTTHNFSFRIKAPSLPVLGTTLGSYLVVNTSTSSVITVVSSVLSTTTDYYKNNFLRILPYNAGNYAYNYNPLPYNSQSSCIVGYSYNVGTGTATFTVSPAFSYIPNIGSPIEILPFSYDNFTPFVYSGSLVSQQDMVCYEVQLINLTLPNAVLTVAEGGRIAYYPYVYVQISNVSATGAGLKNIIYSNNPNATNVIFRAQIYDIQDPLSTPFVRIDGGAMTQTIKFKPNDNLYFRVTLSTGETYNTILKEFYSPIAPNPRSQITAVFSFRRSD